MQARKAAAPTTFPLGQMPVLTLQSGAVVAQSGAHMRFAAKKAGLYPRDDDERALLIDECLATTDEMMGKTPQNPDAAVKQTLREAFVASPNGLPKYLGFFERKLAASGGPFLLGSDLTLADIDLLAALVGIESGSWDFVPPSVLPAPLTAHMAAVRAHPLVVKHGKDV
jgi:glutathione S-transferase